MIGYDVAGLLLVARSENTMRRSDTQVLSVCAVTDSSKVWRIQSCC
jgi:hypothetical protein